MSRRPSRQRGSSWDGIYDATPRGRSHNRCLGASNRSTPSGAVLPNDDHNLLLSSASGSTTSSILTHTMHSPSHSAIVVTLRTRVHADQQVTTRESTHAATLAGRSFLNAFVNANSSFFFSACCWLSLSMLSFVFGVEPHLVCDVRH